MHRCDRIPKVSIQPAPSHHRSPTRSHTVRRHGVGPITASRRSKIGPINFPRQHACKPRYDRIPEESIQPASLHHRSSTRSKTVRRHGHSPTAASRRSKIGHVDQPRQHACKPRYDRIPEVSKQPASSLHRSPTLSQTVRGYGHSPTSASRQSKIGPGNFPSEHACKPRYDRIPEVSKQSVPPHHDSPTCSRSNGTACRPPAPTCVQASV